MNQYSRVPLELKQRHQWVNWKYITRDGKDTKVPFMPNGHTASSTGPETWSSFKAVVDAEKTFDGIGFVFDPTDPYVGIDLDGCRYKETGKIEPWAKELIVSLGSYAEVSPSGTGVKIFGSSGFRWSHRKKVELDLPSVCDKQPAIEIYDGGRYFCVTGRMLKSMVSVVPVDEHFDAIADKFGMREAIAVVSGDSIRMETPVMDRAAKYVACMEPSISGQSGHNKCFAAACVLVMGFGLSESEALQILKTEFNGRCQPPWSERDLVHKVKSAASQPGARNYLRDANPQDWSRIRLPGNYREQISDNAKEMPSLRKCTLKDAAKRYIAELASGRETLIDTGIPELDMSIGGGVAIGEMVIIAARPSHGKSAVALQMAHAMSANGFPIVMISEEMSALALGKRALQYLSETPEEHWRTSIDEISKDVDLHFGKRESIQIVESCGTVERACEEIELAVNEHGAKVAIVDYAQLLQANGNGRYEQITIVSQKLRMLASRLQILVIVLAQLNREIENRNRFVPKMSDIKETGQLEQDADVIIFGVWPHRIDSEKPPRKYLFFVAKNRNRAINNPAIECEFQPSRQRLVESSVTEMPNYEDAF
jgi:KaiC/GvpD/RAD55 family RecA-like ATPase